MPARRKNELRTERLVLRPVLASDVGVLLAIRNHPRVLATTATGAELPVERMRRQLSRWRALWRERDVGTWIIELDAKPVGFVALDPIGEGHGVDPEALEIGVVVHPDHWGNGIAGEAGLAVAVDCFTRAGLANLYATVDPQNSRSQAVIAKAPGPNRLVSKDEEELYEFSAEPQFRSYDGSLSS